MNGDHDLRGMRRERTDDTDKVRKTFCRIHEHQFAYFLVLNAVSSYN